MIQFLQFCLDYYPLLIIFLVSFPVKDVFVVGRQILILISFNMLRFVVTFR